MNSLPDHRRAINGRTHSAPWSASSFDPITRYRRSTGSVASVLLAVAIGISLALVIVRWIDWSWIDWSLT